VELRALYEAREEERGPAVLPDGGLVAPGQVELPAVDFARERVIVREGVQGEGISWAVNRGDTDVVGLLSCVDTDPKPSCFLEVIAVASVATRAESRKCLAVGCGQSPYYIRR
jgi:hypothetical protein